jgi:hypothetical protein
LELLSSTPAGQVQIPTGMNFWLGKKNQKMAGMNFWAELKKQKKR